MKILCCNPLFLEYRLPLYVELKRLFGGAFHVLYSPKRYFWRRKTQLEQRIREELGENAHTHMKEHVYDAHTHRWDTPYDPSFFRCTFIAWGLFASIDRVKPDVLITIGYFQWTPWVLLYGVLHGIPVYMSYERTPHTERNCGKLKLWQRKFFNRFFTGFFVNGIETRKYLESLGVSPSKLHTAGMSADSERMRSGVEAFRQKLEECKKFRNGIIGDAAQPGIVFLFTGNVSEAKGIMYLMQAWQVHIHRHPHDHLVVIGDGHKMEECRRLAQEMPSIHMEGRIPYEQVSKYYAISDVCILPTLTDNWSLVIPEAMACGLAVATSIYNGCHPELIHEGVNGYTFDPLKPETIVDVLHRFHLSDLSAMGKASVELERPFSVENSARRIYEALQYHLPKEKTDAASR